METTIMWFSAGVSSAVACKLMIEDIDKIVYIHIQDQHEDTLRFVQDVANWVGKRIEIITSDVKTVEEACYAAGGRGYVNGPGGAACTRRLKRMVRAEWEAKFIRMPLRYVWGFDAGEQARAASREEAMPERLHSFPLIDRGVNKSEAHKILRASGIKRPAMYDLGYNNNNCIGCVKGGMGYWNHIRVDFPLVFKARAEMERKIRATCIKGVYLDELDPERGRHSSPVVEDCGILCGSMGIA